MNRQWALMFLTVAMLAGAANAFGCTVCFGESDDPIVKGAEASVLFMVIVTYTLLVGGVVTFILLRRRARRLAEQSATMGSTSVAPSRAIASPTRLAAEQGAYRQ